MLALREWSTRHQPALWKAGLLLACLSLGAGAALSYLRWDKRAAVLIKLQQARSDAAKVSGGAHSAPVTSTTFVSDLPVSMDVEAIVQRLASTALLNAVVLTDSRVQRASSLSEAELPRANLSFGLRGPYPAIKATLADSLARTGHATLHSLSIRRDGKPEVEAQVVVSLWHQPLQAPARGRPTTRGGE